MNVSERIDRALSRAACPICGDDRETVFHYDCKTQEMVCRVHGPIRRRFPRHPLQDSITDRWEDWANDLMIDHWREEIL
jgi:hypothetical protein